MICINPKKNFKLLETFNNDPYYDIVVYTATSEFHLVMGYISIDSLYFDQVSPDAKEINLQHLPESPLIKILRSLYGEQLWSSNAHQLSELYSIIEFLQINEYKDNIIKYIVEHPQLMDSFQLIQFCFSKHILQEQLRNHHFASKLSVFASTKNYLQLNKLSQKTLNSLLLNYHQLKGSSADHTINSIIENYLGRTEIRPNDYFLQPELEPLLLIWEKYHHSISYLIAAQDKVKHSQNIDSQNFKRSMNQTTSFASYQYPISSLGTLPNMASSMSPYNGGNTMRHNYQTNGVFVSELEQKQKKILELQTELALKKQIVERLKEEAFNKRNQIKSNRIIDSDDEIKDDPKNKSKAKSSNYLNITTSGDNEISLIQPAFNNDRKVVNDRVKDVKTMNKLNERSRRIFN